MLVASAEKLNFEEILYVTAKPLLPLLAHCQALPFLLLLPQQNFHKHQLCTHPCLYIRTHKNCEHCLDRMSFLTDMLSPSFSRSPPFLPCWCSHQNTASIPTPELFLLPPPVQLCVCWLNAARSRLRSGFENSALITVITVRVPNSQSLLSGLGAGC